MSTETSETLPAYDLASHLEAHLQMGVVYISGNRSVAVSREQATELIRRLKRLEQLEEIAEALIVAEQDRDGFAHTGAMEQLYRLMEEGR